MSCTTSPCPYSQHTVTCHRLPSHFPELYLFSVTRHAQKAVFSFSSLWKKKKGIFNSISNSFLVYEFLKLSSLYSRMPLISAQYTSIKNVWELLSCPFQKCHVPRSLHILSSKFESEVFHIGSCFGSICSQIMLFLENDGDVGFENQGLQREVVDIWGQWRGTSLSSLFYSTMDHELVILCAQMPSATAETAIPSPSWWTALYKSWATGSPWSSKNLIMSDIWSYWQKKSQNGTHEFTFCRDFRDIGKKEIAHTHTYTHSHEQTHMHMHMHTHTCTSEHAYTCIHTH